MLSGIQLASGNKEPPLKLKFPISNIENYDSLDTS